MSCKIAEVLLPQEQRFPVSIHDHGFRKVLTLVLKDLLFVGQRTKRPWSGFRWGCRSLHSVHGPLYQSRSSLVPEIAAPPFNGSRRPTESSSRPPSWVCRTNRPRVPGGDTGKGSTYHVPWKTGMKSLLGGRMVFRRREGRDDVLSLVDGGAGVVVGYGRDRPERQKEYHTYTPLSTSPL